VDFDSFANALKAVFREKPDYVVIGELRDLESISLALKIAETSLVFATLHPQSSAETISCLVDAFPADQQDQIHTQLTAALQGIVCQNLVRTADGKGRVAAVEIMNITQSIKTKIIKNQLNAITSDLQVGKDHGAQTMDSHLVELAKSGRIKIEAALEQSHRRADMILDFGGEREVERLVAQQAKRTDEPA
jgi:twitching motility protein PilT